jgi:bifunctional UDP-N-acetylglucosamine pyrophosphorylase/glucosamine-1-phosphate N-acetyltransferase
MAIALVILAAGQGTRMNSDLPKALHPIGGAPLLAHALQAGAALSPDRTIVVTGHGAEAVEAAGRAIDPEAEFVQQSEQLGTGHAVSQAEQALKGFDGDVAVLFVDTPFLRGETLTSMRDRREAGADLVVPDFSQWQALLPMLGIEHKEDV